MLGASPATALTCIARTDAAPKLLAEHGETLLWQGVLGGGNVMELYLSPRGSWTLLESSSTSFVPGQMMSCVRASGPNWATHQPVGPET